MNLIKKFLPVIIVVLFSYWSVAPFFNSGFFPMHDDTQVARVYQMQKSLSDGQFPVRWVADLGYGYGYPIFNFYAPFAYYVGGFINLLGFSALTATKLMMGLGVILAGVFMYFLAAEFWGRKGGVIAGLLYVYAPYHAVNIYVRGAVAEFWAYAFLPLAFLGIYKIFTNIETFLSLENNSKIKNQKSKMQLKSNKTIWYWVCLSAVGYAGIILSHNLTAMMVTPFLFAFAFFIYIKLRLSEKIYKPYYVLLGLFIGVLIAGFYWVPVLFEMKYTNVLSVVGGGSDYRDHFVCLSQLLGGVWGFGGSIPGCLDGLSFKIGKVHMLLTLLALPGVFFSLRKNKSQLMIMLFFALSLAFSLFIMTDYSKFVWDSVPQMAFFQFPWRFLILTSFFTSFFGGAVILYLKDRNNLLRLAAAVVIITGVIFYNAKLFVPQKIISVKSDEITSKGNLSWTISKISDEYMPKRFKRPLSENEVPKSRFRENKNINISDLTEKSHSILFLTDSKKSEDLGVNLAYFPGWHVFIDDTQVWFKYYNGGIIIKVPPGKHTVRIKYSQTNVQKFGNTLSVSGVFLLFSGIIAQRKRRSYAKKVI